MKKIIHKSLSFVSCGMLLLLSVTGYRAGAAVLYWDPQGTTGANPYTGSMSGTWESSLWSSSSSGQATPVAWTNGDAACFGVHTGKGTPAFTVTMNGNHTVAGIFDGPLTPNSAIVTITGTGIMTMQTNNLNGFALFNATDGSLANVYVNVPIAGGPTAGICAEESGQLFLNATNTFSGGTYLGYSGASFTSGLWNFNNNVSFGVGPLYFLNCTGGALVSEGSSAINITNPMIMYQQNPASLNIVGNPAGVTFSGPWILSNGSGGTGATNYATPALYGNYGTLSIGSGAASNNLVTIAGTMTGSCAFIKYGIGILDIIANNSNLSGPVTVNNGTLQIGNPLALGCVGALSTNGNITVSAPGTLDLNGNSINASLNLNGWGTNSINAFDGALVNSATNTTAVLEGGAGIVSAQVFDGSAGLSTPPPTVSVDGGGGSGCTAIASLGLSVSSFTINPGTQKYNTPPTVTISGGGGSNAIVTLTLSAGAPSIVNSTPIVVPGFGYTSDVTTVTLSGGSKSGSGTAPTVTYNSGNFQVMGFQITSPGSNYTSQPTLDLSSGTGYAVGLLPSVNLASTTAIGGPGNITINSPVSGPGSLTNTGPGTLTLTAANTYYGSTVISGAFGSSKLVGVVGGSCASSSIEVAPGSGPGNIFSVQVPDSTLQWTCAGLTFDDSSSTMDFDFGPFVVPSTNTPPLVIDGSVTFTGTPIVTVEAGSLPPGPGTYPLMMWYGGISDTPPTSVILPPKASGYLSVVGNTLYLNITANTEPLRWAANGAGTWDTSSVNWDDSSGNPAAYTDGDSVIFDETRITSPTTVTLNNTFSPEAMTVTNSVDTYTITGSGGIAGATGLEKFGKGTLTLACSNSYTGGTMINGGTLRLGDGVANNGSLVGNIVNNSILAFANPSAQTNASPISGTGAVTVSGSAPLFLDGVNTYGGPTTNTGSLFIGGSGTLGAGDYTNDVVNSGTFTYDSSVPQTLAGTISGTGILVQSGSGVLTLNGTNAYTGNTTITAGTLTVGSNGLGGGSYSGNIANTGTLVFDNSASQTLAGAISGNGAMVLNGPGAMTLSGNNTFTTGPTVNTGSTLNVNTISDSGNSELGNSGTVTLGGGTFNYTGASPVTTTRQFSGASGTTSTFNSASAMTISGRFTAQVSGNFYVNYNGPGALTLANTADNSFLGMNINGATVILNTTSASGVHGLGNATTVGSGGVLQLSGSGGFDIYSGVALTVNSGGVFDVNSQNDAFTSLSLAGTGIGGNGALINSSTTATSGITNKSGITLAANTSIGGAGNIILAGVISGGNALTYIGSGILTLASNNTFSGGTTINSGTVEVGGSIQGNVLNTAGTLKLDKTNALSVGATLTLASSPAAGAVNLAFTGTNTITALNFGSTSMAQGTWGSATSPALHQSAIFIGNGVINVTSGGVNQTITSFNNPGDQTYGVAPLSLSATASSGLPVTFTVVSGPATVVGNNLTITGAGAVTVQANQNGNSTTNAATPVDVSFNVNPLPVVLNGSKLYDGTAIASYSILTVANKVGSDNVFLASGSADLAGSSIGTQAIISPDSLTLGGTAAANYTLTDATGSVVISNEFSITSVSLDVTGTNVVIVWQSVPNSVYQLLSGTNLTAPLSSWGKVGSSITATGSSTVVTNSKPAASVQFYRVEQQ